jgi:hypothetical protein
MIKRLSQVGGTYTPSNADVVFGSRFAGEKPPCSLLLASSGKWLTDYGIDMVKVLGNEIVCHARLCGTGLMIGSKWSKGQDMYREAVARHSRGGQA